ncbi:class I SAM-dependent methyltransferase [bacterium]|nr:class I SAM-dependent methyltransferase [bacterium]MCB2179215.1 class I SAM-dependent methyltransferase [bacterium]
MNLEQDSTYFHELQTKTGWGRMLASFANWCAPQPGDWMLDVGCGPGQLPAMFAQGGVQAFGVDHDAEMFASPLHNWLAFADAVRLPFPAETFHLVTASNVLFLVTEPLALLREMVRVMRIDGEICLLNPSEQMSVDAAAQLADGRNLQGLARETLLNYAQRAEGHHRWDEAGVSELFQSAGIQLTETTLRMGPGLVRYARGRQLIAD